MSACGTPAISMTVASVTLVTPRQGHTVLSYASNRCHAHGHLALGHEERRLDMYGKSSSGVSIVLS